MKRSVSIAAALALLVTLGVTARAAVEIPAQPLGRVSDFANRLTPSQRAALEAQLQSYEQQRGGAGQAGAPQIAVVILPSLGGDPVADVAMRFAERWKLGSKADDGVLLMVSVDDRKIRIEVGYGAESRLTDGQSARIIRELIGPRLHVGDYADGLVAGVIAIHQALSGQPVTGVGRTAGAGTLLPVHGQEDESHPWPMLGLFVIVMIILASRERGSASGGATGNGSDQGGGDSGGGGFSGGGGSFGGGGASGDF